MKISVITALKNGEDFIREIVGSLDPKNKAAWNYDLWLKMVQRSRPRHIRKQFTSFRRHTVSISENHFERQFVEELDIAKCLSKIYKLYYLQVN